VEIGDLATYLRKHEFVHCSRRHSFDSVWIKLSLPADTIAKRQIAIFEIGRIGQLFVESESKPNWQQFDGLRLQLKAKPHGATFAWQ
jgi:hypothetical protein